jgi:hypothetical protein
MEIKSYIEGKLKKQLPSHIFLNRMRVIDEDSRQSFAYNDHTYVPFYYWLGTILKPKTMIEIGLRLGLLSGNFLKSCKTVNKFVALQEDKSGEYYSSRLAKANIKDNYKGDLYVHVGVIDDEIFSTKLKSMEFDLAIINEETSYDRHRLYFDLLWPQMAGDGLIVVDYVEKHKSSSVAVKDFCVSINLEPIYINTTYGVALIRKV